MVNYTVFTLIKKKRQQVTNYNGNCWKCVCVCARVYASMIIFIIVNSI